MNFIQPSIDPVILSIGFIEIRWYSLAYILGFLLGIYIIKRLNKIYGNLLPPLSLLSEVDERNLLQSLKDLNFETKSQLAA